MSTYGRSDDLFFARKIVGFVSIRISNLLLSW